MKIFDRYSTPGSKNLMRKILIEFFFSVIFVNNKFFSNNKNQNLKLRFYDLQSGSRIISTHPFGEPHSRVNARNINGSN